MRIICLDGTKYSGPRTQLNDTSLVQIGDVLIWPEYADDNELYTATLINGRTCCVSSWQRPARTGLAGTICRYLWRLTEFERRNLCP